MFREKIASELVKVAKDLVSANKDVFFVKQGSTYTLWVSYAPNSGMVSIFKGGIDGYRTDKTSDSKYDGIVRLLYKNLPLNRVVPIPIYDYNSDASKYDVYGGSLKPFKKAYAVLSQDNDIVVNFFDRAGEAKGWLRTTVKSKKAFSRRDLDDAIDLCEELGIDYELYEDYSGRGMYGKTTTGLVISRGAFREIKDSDLDFNYDSMGMDIIIY